MKIVRRLAIATMLVLPVAAHAATTSPGKNAVHANVGGVLGLQSLIVPVEGQILKGKKHTVVEIQATLSVVQNANLKGLQLFAAINGVAFAGMGIVTSECNTAAAVTDSCTLTATYWMDVDAAEASYPGQYVGQPLSVSINGGDIDPAALTVGQPYSVTFSARMGKK